MSAVLIFPATVRHAMAGLVANSLLVFIPYSGNGLSLCVVLVHRALELMLQAFY